MVSIFFGGDHFTLFMFAVVSSPSCLISVKSLKHHQKIFFVVIALLCGSCSSEHSAMSQAVINPVKNSIPPGSCRISGTIIGIDSTLDLSDPAQPCAKVPCNADVRIDSVLGYGSAFGTPVVQGKEYKMHFVFTLSPTSKELFPLMNTAYPGLHTGSSFIADIKRQDSGRTPDVRHATQSVVPVFVIYSYSRLTKSPH